MTLRFSDIRKQVATLEVAERFFDSLILFQLYELGVFRELSEGPRGAATLASAVDGREASLRALLDAGVAVGLLERDEDGKYSAPENMLACLGDPDSPAYLGDWLTFLATFVSPVTGLAETVRTGRPVGSMVDGSERDNRPAQAMTAAMEAYAGTRGLEFAGRLDLTGVETILDVGCGPGTYSLALAEGHPDLHAILLDLPGPIDHAREHVNRRGLGERVTLAACDAFDFEPQRPVQLVLVSNVLHMLGPERSRALLERCAKLVEPGGRVVVQAEYLNEDRTSPRWPALLNLLMQATTEEGRNHDLGETARWLEAAGLVDIEHMRLSPWNVNSALIGRRPENS